MKTRATNCLRGCCQGPGCHDLTSNKQDESGFEIHFRLLTRGGFKSFSQKCLTKISLNFNKET